MQESTPDKPALRRLSRARRPDGLAARTQSAAVTTRLMAWLADRPERTIAGYMALPGEPDLAALYAALPDRRWVLPRVDGHLMDFRRTDFTTSVLQAGMFGIAEPAADSPVCPLEEIELFLCPGMAFSAAGHRLGRGKGYYDRALERVPATVRVGVCFREMIFPEIPTEPHDLPMHFIATPDGIGRAG